MRIAICDDEDLWRETVTKKIDNYLRENNIKAELFLYKSGVTLLNEKKKFDIIFLDMIMGEITGIETASSIRKFDSSVKIVFVSSYSGYMQEAFHVNAFRYLEKDFKKEDIASCFNAYFEEKKNNGIIEVDIMGVMTPLVQKSILYITAIKNGTIIQCNNNSLISSFLLKDFSQLLDNQYFFQCHRNTIINITQIKRLSDTIAVVQGNYKVSVSKRNKNELKKIYTNYMVNNMESME